MQPNSGRGLGRGKWINLHMNNWKRVTKNRGARTAGTDGVIWSSTKQKMEAVKSLKRHAYKAKPLRRIYIPKKNGKLRPLGIPTMIDRAQQALHLLALEPIAELTADKH